MNVPRDATERDLADIDRWIAACSCDACERYRRCFALRAGRYAAAIEQQLRQGSR